MPDLPDRLAEALKDRYTLLRELGRGGMATVYLATDIRHERSVALKVLNPELAAVLGHERFLREIKIATSLTHPHILPLYDSGSAAARQGGGTDFLFYVMPYVEGESLRDRLNRERQLPLDDALQISREVADALSYAHSRGVIHRDIKPENILLESGHAVVADFGIARAIDSAGGDRLTETGVALGTPTYMSPEQAGGSRDLDGRSDLYSLGCVLYEMLAGEPPFTGPTIESVIRQHLSAEPPHITNIRPSVPSWVVAALERSLAKTPADRFNPVAQFGEAIAPRVSLAEVRAVRPRAPKRRWWIPAAAITVLAVGAAAVATRLGLFTAGESPPIGPRPYTILAEFEGSAPQDVRDAARTLLSAVLDESNIVQALPDDRVRRGLVLAGRADTTPLSGGLAQELAFRSGIRTVVAGSLDQVGRAFSLALRVVDVNDSTVILTARERAESEDELLDAVDRTGRALRRGFGERRSAIQSNRPASDVITPSFGAYLKYAEATPFAAGPKKITLLREAIHLDSAFASAWLALGVAYFGPNVGLYDSARTALAFARRYPERLTPAGALALRGAEALLQNDMPAALAAYQEMVDKYDMNRTGLGYVLAHLGRGAETKELLSMEADRPFPTTRTLRNLAERSAKRGEFQDASDAVERLDDPALRLWLRTELSLVSVDWVRADSLAAALTREPAAPVEWRQRGAAVRAALDATRGAVANAVRVLDSIETSWRAEHSRPSWEFGGAAGLLRLAAGMKHPPPRLTCADDGMAETIISCAFEAAIAGDTAYARAQLAVVARRDPAEVARLGCGPRLVEGAIAIARGAWETVPALLATAVDWNWPSKGTVDAGNVVRWLVAAAYEPLGRADSAARVFELLASPTNILNANNDWRVHQGLVVYAFAHFRLGRLYTQLGKYDDAKEHYATFLDTFTQPDPEYMWMVTEARAKLEELARGR